MEQTSEHIAEIHAWLAAQMTLCTACNGVGVYEYQGTIKKICKGCKGTGSVPLLPGLRRICLECQLPESFGVKPEVDKWCKACHGSSWVLAPSDTDTLLDALEERYGSGEHYLEYQTCKAGRDRWSARLTLDKTQELGLGRNRREALWVAAENLVKNVKEGT